jgi:heat shock protein HtpX
MMTFSSGHELMHVYNRDILTSSVAAAVAGIITSFAQFAQLSFLFGRGNNNNPLAMIGVLASAILAPIAATLIQLAISRTREYDADEDGSALTGDPLALASALRKLEQGTQRAPLPPERQLVNASHLFIANPFKKGGGMQSMFATHPPMDQRIARLEQLAYGSPR